MSALGQKVTEFPDKTDIVGGEYLYVAYGGQDYKITVDQIVQYMANLIQQVNQVEFDSAGNALPDGFDSYAQTLGYDGSGNVTTITATGAGGTYVQTLTYASYNVSGVSAWVKL